MSNDCCRQFFYLLFEDDLWTQLSHASSKPVAAVMDTWTKQMGFPVLSVAAEQVDNDTISCDFLGHPLLFVLGTVTRNGLGLTECTEHEFSKEGISY